MEENSSKTAKPPTGGESTRSGGIDISGSAKFHAQGDVVGRDKIMQTIEAARPFANSRFSLKAPPPDFEGREHEIDLLVKQLVREENPHKAPIAGVVGMGGVGKSALASMVAERIKGEYPEAQIWIDMQGTRAEPLKPTDAMRQVILAFEPGVDLEDANDARVGQMYRDALNGKRALLVLDNAKDGPQIRPLLEARVAVLVTARTYLTAPGLNPLRLDALDEAEARTFLLSLCERVGGKAGEIVELCGRLPLALRIAGSHLAARPNVSVEAYTESLREKRLDLLKVRGDGELDVEAAFALTYERMDSEIQRLWRLLGVFPIWFKAEAAGYIWRFGETKEEAEQEIVQEGDKESPGDPRSDKQVEYEAALPILEKVKAGLNTLTKEMKELASEEARLHAEEVLGDMVSDSLVEFEAEPPKYRVHDLLAVYARKKWSKAERDQALSRFAKYFVLTTAPAISRIIGSLFRVIP